MLIEPDAERIILSQPSNLILPGCSSPTATTARSRHGSRSGSPRSSRTGSPARASSPTRCLRQVSTHLESPAPSVISILDDIPRTPKKPTGSVLDPSNPSVLAEVLFLSIGTVALGAGLFVVYRLLRRR
ncbi:PDZ domain containing protein [Aphelenchoides besseyi]|nr:PDZ domain containing protein [Aphelenchoides besseyi]